MASQNTALGIYAETFADVRQLEKQFANFVDLVAKESVSRSMNVVVSAATVVWSTVTYSEREAIRALKSVSDFARDLDSLNPLQVDINVFVDY